jgi:hypothetical protein
MRRSSADYRGGRAERAETQRHRERLLRLLRFLDVYVPLAVAGKGKPREKAEPILKLIREWPEIRTSMLAMLTERATRRLR